MGVGMVHKFDGDDRAGLTVMVPACMSADSVSILWLFPWLSLVLLPPCKHIGSAGGNCGSRYLCGFLIKPNQLLGKHVHDCNL